VKIDEDFLHCSGTDPITNHYQSWSIRFSGRRAQSPQSATSADSCSVELTESGGSK
jgi:hypothetical protein